MTMTSLERIGTVLSGGIPDRVPAAPLVCGAARRVYGATYAEWAQDGELAAKCMVQMHELIGVDGILGLLDLSVEAADFGQKIIYPIEDTPHPDYDQPFITGPDDYAKVERIDVAKAPRMQEILKYMDIVCNELAKDTAIMGFVYGPMGILSMMRGAENLFKDCYKHPEEVLVAVKVITEVLIDFIRAYAKTGVHAIVFDTLFASQSIMSKKMWKKMEGPYAKIIADEIRANNMMVIVHNCGNGIYFDVQMEAMEPVCISYAEPSDDCKTHAEVKEKWGKKTCLCGYASPATYAFLATPEEMKMECKREIEEMGKDGGFILSTGCEFPPNGSLLNAIAMMEAAELYGKY